MCQKLFIFVNFQYLPIYIVHCPSRREIFPDMPDNFSEMGLNYAN